MGRNLPPGMSISDLEDHTEVPERHGGVEDTRNYGDEAECAVCGKPLRRPPHHPEEPDFCESHDRDDLRVKEKHIDEQIREREGMTAREKRLEEEYAEQQDHYEEH